LLHFYFFFQRQRLRCRCFQQVGVLHPLMILRYMLWTWEQMNNNRSSSILERRNEKWNQLTSYLVQYIGTHDRGQESLSSQRGTSRNSVSYSKNNNRRFRNVAGAVCWPCCLHASASIWRAWDWHVHISIIHFQFAWPLVFFGSVGVK
jgi:hypothetical protein